MLGAESANRSRMLYPAANQSPLHRLVFNASLPRAVWGRCSFAPRLDGNEKEVATPLPSHTQNEPNPQKEGNPRNACEAYAQEPLSLQSHDPQVVTPRPLACPTLTSRRLHLWSLGGVKAGDHTQRSDFFKSTLKENTHQM